MLLSSTSAKISDRERSKPESLFDLIRSNDLAFAMEAHDAVSAAIAAKAGFPALWASGLTISTSLGYRDASEASWTEVVEVVDRMARATDLPVLVDGDTGFGNFNNARIVARRLHQHGAAGICIEDKQFPKLNSFVDGPHQLADVIEFCGRLKAVKDTVSATDFVLVARIEALICGQGQSEALKRAHAYADAGADAILIHSRKSDPAEIFDFTREWQNRLPIVVVPTKYYTTPAADFREEKIAMVIWANHSLRAAVAAMREVCRRIRQEEGVGSVEHDIASLADVFELLAYDELANAERRYFPASVKAARH